MSKELLQVVIDEGVKDNLNAFFCDVSNDYIEIEGDLSAYDDDRFTGFQAIGEIIFNPNEKLVVVTAEVLSDLTERSGKKAQYEKAKKILKDYMKYDAGIFVFSDPAGNFRFSLVYGQAEGTKKAWSNFRRFTYFVSRDQTNNTFLRRVGGGAFSTLDIIKDAFSVEKVTKDFYKQIADWYFWAVQNVTFPANAEQESNGRNIAVIRMITRLIFIWFMKERKLVSPDLFNQEKISALLKSLKPGETTYYKAILQNLFFATLNTQIEERKFRFAKSYHGKNKDYMEHKIYRYEDYFKNRENMMETFKDIPFLNGGLFDCLDWSAKESGTDAEVRFDGFSDKEVGLNVPNYLFFSGEKEADLNKDYGTKNKTYRVQGLLNILSAYNFTIDENDPNDQEVALDPELLGKVFENLLASFNPETATTARKATGSYYTPREIVDYMVTQSLKQYYKTHLSDVAFIDNKLEELLSPITEEPVNPFGETDSKRVVKLTEELRIVDPAVGSGAFPMGILNKLVSVLARVDPNNRLWQEAQLKAVEAVTDPLLKQKLIKQINEQFSEKKSNYGRKLYLIQKCIYGVDIQQIAIEIAKLRFFIALLVDETIDKSKPNWGIEPLPNLDFKLIQGNSLISEFMDINLDAEDSDSYGKLMKDEMDELISRYRNKKSEYQYEPDRDKKESLKSEIEKLIAQMFESKLQSQKAEYFTKLKNIERKYANVPNIQQRNEIIKRDTDTLNKNYRFDLAQAERQLKEFTSGQKVKPFFAWKLYFAEVFHEKSGFDIAIANPPYINAIDFRNIYGDSLREEYNRRFETASGTYDIFVLFFEKGLALLNNAGCLCLITPNKYLSAKYAISLRTYILKCSTLLHLADLSTIDVFKAVSVYPVITILRSGDIGNKKPISILQPINRLQNSFEIERFRLISIPRTMLRALPENIWGFLLSDKAKYLASFLNGAKPLSEYGEINATSTASESDSFGVYFSNDEVRNSLRVINTGTIDRYASLWGIKNMKHGGASYLTPYLHLDKANITQHRKSIYRSPKIIFAKMAISCEAFLDVNGEYASVNTNCFYKPRQGVSIKFLVAYCNSRLFMFFYEQFFGALRMSGGYFQFQAPQLRVIPTRHPSDKNTLARFEAKVDKIISLKKENPYATTAELESEIDQMVYELYGLTPGEIAVVEGSNRK